MSDITLTIGDDGEVDNIASGSPLDGHKVEFTIEPEMLAELEMLPLKGDVHPITNLSMNRTAVGNLQKYRVVKQVGDNGATYPDINLTSDADLVLGVTIEAAGSGNGLTIRLVGEIEDPDWNWSPGALYCGAQGELTQLPPSGAWQRQIGAALSPTKILVALRPAGATARTILNGLGAPTMDVGAEADYYVDTENHRFYGPKTNLGWGAYVSLRGPEGPQGNMGAEGPAGPPAPIRMNVFVGDRPGPQETLLRYIVIDPMTLDLEKCRASAELPALVDCTFTLARNGLNFMEISFVAGTTQAIINAYGDSVGANEILTLKAPLIADEQLAQISFLLSWSTV